MHVPLTGAAPRSFSSPVVSNFQDSALTQDWVFARTTSAGHPRGHKSKRDNHAADPILSSLQHHLSLEEGGSGFGFTRTMSAGLSSTSNRYPDVPVKKLQCRTSQRLQGHSEIPSARAQGSNIPDKRDLTQQAATSINQLRAPPDFSQSKRLDKQFQVNEPVRMRCTSSGSLDSSSSKSPHVSINFHAR